MLCKVIFTFTDRDYLGKPDKTRNRLCHPEPADAFYFDAKSLQPSLSRRRARNDAHSQGAFFSCNSSHCNAWIPQHLGVGCIPWSPLARGLLARPLDSEKTARASTEMQANLKQYIRERFVLISRFLVTMDDTWRASEHRKLSKGQVFHVNMGVYLCPFL